jgi:hypothetical protein
MIMPCLVRSWIFSCSSSPMLGPRWVNWRARQAQQFRGYYNTNHAPNPALNTRDNNINVPDPERHKWSTRVSRARAGNRTAPAVPTWDISHAVGSHARSLTSTSPGALPRRQGPLLGWRWMVPARGRRQIAMEKTTSARPTPTEGGKWPGRAITSSTRLFLQGDENRCDWLS